MGKAVEVLKLQKTFYSTDLYLFNFLLNATLLKSIRTPLNHKLLCCIFSIYK